LLELSTRLDYFHERNKQFNALIPSRCEYLCSGPPPLYSVVAREVTFPRCESDGIYFSKGEPSDGHPQEELTPDFQCFRALGHNISTRVLYWPDLEV
jgi:hypothetical protein